MESIATDLFATKGVEYLLVIGYLIILVAGWRMIFPRKSREPVATEPPQEVASHWFFLPAGFYFHQGHAWAAPDDGDLVRVGVDDFAQRLLGLSNGFVLPPLGAQLRQGEPGWEVQLADGNSMSVLAPVDGDVVAVNPEVLLQPSLVNTEPYDRGWLMKLRVRNAAAVRRNLLTGSVARAWMEDVSERLPHTHSVELGIVLPGGTFGVTGIARAVSPHGWQQVAREYLLLEDVAPEAAAVADYQASKA